MHRISRAEKAHCLHGSGVTLHVKAVSEWFCRMAHVLPEAMHLLCRRKKPAWATSQASHADEAHATAAAGQRQQPDAAYVLAPQASIASSQHHAATSAAAPATVMLQAFHAVHAADAEANETHLVNPQPSQPDLRPMSEASASTTAAAAAVVDAAEQAQHGQGGAAGVSPAEDASSISPDSQAASSSRAVKSDQHVHSHSHVPHYLSMNSVTLSRNSSVAQEQTAIQKARARQASIEKHVLNHDMFKGSAGQLPPTVHR